MQNKTIGIITIALSIFLCGLPGLAGLCFGSLSLVGAFFSEGGIPSEDRLMVAGSSIMILGLSLMFIAIPIGITIWFWWSQKSEAAAIQKLTIPVEDF